MLITRKSVLATSLLASKDKMCVLHNEMRRIPKMYANIKNKLMWYLYQSVYVWDQVFLLPVQLGLNIVMTVNVVSLG